MNDSLGSAVQENERYMQSLEAQTKNLEATWQNFANNVINKDLVSALLNLANGALGILDNSVGTTVTRFALLTAGLTGTAGIAKEILPPLIAGLTSVGTGTAVATTGLAGFIGVLGSFLPYAAVLSGIAIAGYEIYKAWKNANPTLEEATKKIEDNTKQLKENKKRLEEINSLSWNERTQEILNEKAALEQENKELQDQIDKLETLSDKKAKQALSGGYVTGERIQVSGITGQYAGRFDAGLQDQSFETYDELVKYLDNYIPGASKKTREELEALGVQFENVQGQVYKTGEAYEQDLIKQAGELIEKLKANHELTDNDLRLYEEVTSKLETLAKAHEVVGDSSTEARDALDGLNTSYQDAVEFTERFGDAIELSEKQVNDLIKLFPEAKDQITKVGDAYYYTGNGAAEAANEILDANGNIVASEKSKVDQVIAQLKRQLDAYAAVVEAKRGVYTDLLKSGMGNSEQAKEAEAEWTSAARAWDKIRQAQNKIGSALAEGRVTYTGTKTSMGAAGGGSGSSKKSSGSKTSSKSTKDTVLENYKERVKVLKSELALMQERGDNEDSQIAKMRQIQDALHQEAEYMRKVGSSQSDINALSQEHWQYTKKINELYKQQLETQKKLVEQKKEELNSQREELDNEYELISKYAQHIADEQIAAIDEQIEELEKVNDELDTQIEKQQLLENLATAKSQRMYVYKDGKFQYVEDVDAISEAEDDLAKFEREQALQEQKDSLEAQKKMWEDYKDGWSSLTEEYDLEQGRLLYLQKYGATVEQQTWDERLSNLKEFKQDYLEQIAEIEAAILKLQELQAALDAKQWAQTGQDWQLGYNTGVNTKASGINQSYVDALGYDPTTDYSALRKEQGYLTEEQEKQRQNKINDMYGGKDPYKSGSSSSSGSYNSGSGSGTSADYVRNSDGTYTDIHTGQVYDKLPSSSSSSSGSSKSSSSSRSNDDRRKEASDALEKSKQTGRKESLGGGVSIDYSKINKKAAGTFSAEGGLTLVGEQGPELRVLNKGDGVLTANLTRSLYKLASMPASVFAGSKNNSSTNISVANVTLPNVKDAQSFVDGLRNYALQRAYAR